MTHSAVPPAVISVAAVYAALVGCAVAYALVVYLLRRGTQSLRTDFALWGEMLVATKALPTAQEKTLRFALENSYNAWMPWLFVLAIPLYGIVSLLGLAKKPPVIANERLRERYHMAIGMWGLGIACLSPIAAVILFAEIFIAAIVIFPFKGADVFFDMTERTLRKVSVGTQRGLTVTG